MQGTNKMPHTQRSSGRLLPGGPHKADHLGAATRSAHTRRTRSTEIARPSTAKVNTPMIKSVPKLFLGVPGLVGASQILDDLLHGFHDPVVRRNLVHVHPYVPTPGDGVHRQCPVSGLPGLT
jgi:hypothetical protein